VTEQDADAEAGFTTELTDRLTAAGCEPALAERIAGLAAGFADEWAEELADASADAFADRIEAAPYDGFDRRWNFVVGDLADGIDDCTDTRDHRLAGFGAVGSTGRWE